MSLAWQDDYRKGMQVDDAECDELYARDLERRTQAAAPTKERWTFGQIALLLFVLILWWAVIAMAWKVWPR